MFAVSCIGDVSWANKYHYSVKLNRLTLAALTFPIVRERDTSLQMHHADQAGCSD